MELPAIIRPAGAGDDDEQSDLLVEALLENDLRRGLDLVEPGAIAPDATLSGLTGCDGACMRGVIVSRAGSKCAPGFSCTESLLVDVSGSDATLLR